MSLPLDSTHELSGTIQAFLPPEHYRDLESLQRQSQDTPTKQLKRRTKASEHFHDETNAASGWARLTGRRRRRRPWWRTWRASWRTSATAAPQQRPALAAAQAPPGSASGSRARRPPLDPRTPARVALSTGPPWAPPPRSPDRSHQSSRDRARGRPWILEASRTRVLVARGPAGWCVIAVMNGFGGFSLAAIWRTRCEGKETTR